MCILFIAVEQHPHFPLIILANRDEFYRRPTRPSHFWPAYPQVLAGQDLVAGGSWMGVSMSGRLSALTNIREPHNIDPNARSRGALVLDYLATGDAATPWVTRLSNSRHQYNGYNLLFGHWQDLKVYNNRLDRVDALSPGCYGLSNAWLNHRWPKVVQGVDALAKACSAPHINPGTLLRLLQSDAPFPLHRLPDTGVPLEWEHKLSSIFIHSPEYGTRSSTLLLIDRQGHGSWTEQGYNQQGQPAHRVECEFDLPLKP